MPRCDQGFPWQQACVCVVQRLRCQKFWGCFGRVLFVKRVHKRAGVRECLSCPAENAGRQAFCGRLWGAVCLRSTCWPVVSVNALSGAMQHTTKGALLGSAFAKQSHRATHPVGYVVVTKCIPLGFDSWPESAESACTIEKEVAGSVCMSFAAFNANQYPTLG